MNIKQQWINRLYFWKDPEWKTAWKRPVKINSVSNIINSFEKLIILVNKLYENQWSIVSVQCSMVNVQCSVFNWKLITRVVVCSFLRAFVLSFFRLFHHRLHRFAQRNGQWSIFSVQCSVYNGQWSVFNWKLKIYNWKLFWVNVSFLIDHL